MGLAFVISLTVFVLEVIGGILSGSLALLSDAGHVLADALALGMSWFALRLAERPASAKATFGYHRVGIMVALINGAALCVMAALIFREAYPRFFSPPEIQTTELLAIAAVGLVANLVMAKLLHAGHNHSLNVRSAWLHVLGDSLASVGVIIAGLVIRFTGWEYADPIISVLIGGLIFIGGVRVIRDASEVLLELPPRGLDMMCGRSLPRSLPWPPAFWLRNNRLLPRKYCVLRWKTGYASSGSGTRPCNLSVMAARLGRHSAIGWVFECGRPAQVRCSNHYEDPLRAVHH